MLKKLFSCFGSNCKKDGFRNQEIDLDTNIEEPTTHKSINKKNRTSNNTRQNSNNTRRNSNNNQRTSNSISSNKHTKRRSLPIVTKNNKCNSLVRNLYFKQQSTENKEYNRRQTLKYALSLYELDNSKTSSYMYGAYSEPLTAKTPIDNNIYKKRSINSYEINNKYEIPKTSIDLKRNERSQKDLFNKDIRNRNSIDEGVIMNISSSIWNTIVQSKSTTSSKSKDIII